MLVLIGGELGHLCLGNDEVEAVVAVAGTPFAQLHTGGSASPLIHAVRGVGALYLPAAAAVDEAEGGAVSCLAGAEAAVGVDDTAAQAADKAEIVLGAYQRPFLAVGC